MQMQLKTILTMTIILFWSVMMGVHVTRVYDLFKGNASSLSNPEAYRSKMLSRDHAIEYELRTGEGTRIGTARRTVERETGQTRVEQSISISLSRISDAGQRAAGTLHLSKTSFYDVSDRLKQFEMVLKLDEDAPLQDLIKQFIKDGRIRITGRRKRGRITVNFHNIGLKKVLTGSEFVDVPDSFNPIGSIVPPEPGSNRTMEIMDPLRNKLIQLSVRTENKPVVLQWNGLSKQVHRIQIRQDNGTDGLNGTAWVTQNGTFLKQRLRHPFLPVELVFLRTTPLPTAPDSG